MAVRRISLGRAVLELDTDLDPFLEGLGKGEKAVKRFSAQTNLLGAGMTSVFGGVTLATAALKVVSFGADLLAAAGSLQDLHERTMVSVEGLQRFSVIAAQSGSSIDAVATAIFQMGKRLAGGDDSAASALDELGLNFAAIRAMRPEDAFDAIGRALGALDDPMKRAELGAKIFGRSVDELIPTFVNLGTETGAYLTLSAGQVKLLDEIGDAFVRLTHSIVPATVALVDYTLGISRFVAAWQSFRGVVNPNDLAVGLDKEASAFARMTAATKANAQAVNDRAAKAAHGIELDFKAKAALDDINDALADNKKRLVEAKDLLAQYNAALANNLSVDAAQRAKSWAWQAAQLDFNGTRAITELERQYKEQQDALANNIRVEEEMRKADWALRASELDSHGMRELAKIDEHFKRVESHSIASLQTTADEAMKTYREMAARSGEFSAATIEDFRQIALDAQRAADGMKTDWMGALDHLANSLTQLAQVSGDAFGGILKDIAQIVVAMNMAAKAAQDFKAAQASGDRMGMATSGIGMVSAMMAATSHRDPHGMGHMDAGSTMKNVLGGAAVGTMIMPGIGTAVGALIGLARSIHKVGEEEKEARKAAQEFASELAKTATVAQQLEAGGEGWKLEVIQVRDAYLKAGLSVADAEAAVTSLWNATQEGAAATAAAQAVIQGVIDFNTDMIDSIHGMGLLTQEELQAIADHAKAVFEYMERTGKYTAEQLAVAWADFEQKQAIAMGELPQAVDEAATAVDELAAKYKSLSDSVAKEAPEKVMGSIETATRAEMATLERQMDAQNTNIKTDAEAAAAALKAALENLQVDPVHVEVVWDIPSVPGSGPVSVDALDGLASTSGGRGGGTAILELDRRVLAEVLVPELPGAIERHGLGR